MNYIFALIPILVVILLMIVFHWGSQQAGPMGWLVCLAIAAAVFGLNWDVWLVSQLKGLVLSLYVLSVIWPALFLYMVVNEMGGMTALVLSLESIFVQRELLWLVLAWTFSGMVEALTGFGLPVAIVAPMLVGLGVEPVLAVAVIAIGHAWAVSFGSMGLGLQTLGAVTQLDPAALAPVSALLLGVGGLGCGLAVMLLLKQGRRWLMVLTLSLAMGLVYYGMASLGMISLAAFAAGLTGTLGAYLWQRLFIKKAEDLVEKKPDAKALKGALTGYGFLIGLMLVTGLVMPLRDLFSGVVLAPAFPEVITRSGLITPAGTAITVRPLLFSGTLLMLACLFSYFLFRRQNLLPQGAWRNTALKTWQAAAPTSLGILAMVGLSTMMDHCGMTQLLASGLTQLTGPIFPLVSPLVGMLGTFTTGSNNNSNVLLAPLQKNVALLLKMDPRLLVSSQTAGGSLGSMTAPSKLVVGCGTVGIFGRDGEVLKRTLPFGLAIGLVVGLVTLLLVAVHF
jgi:lactate permease